MYGAEVIVRRFLSSEIMSSDIVCVVSEEWGGI